MAVTATPPSSALPSSSAAPTSAAVPTQVAGQNSPLQKQEGLLQAVSENAGGAAKLYRISKFVLGGAALAAVAFWAGRERGYFEGRSEGALRAISLGNSTSYAHGLAEGQKGQMTAESELRGLVRLVTMDSTDLQKGVQQVTQMLQRVQLSEEQKKWFDECKEAAHNMTAELKVCQEKIEDQLSARIETGDHCSQRLDQKQKEFDNLVAAEREAGKQCREELHSIASGGVLSALWGVIAKILS